MVINRRRPVEYTSDAVARIAFDDTASIGLCDRLNDPANLCIRHARPTNGNRGIEALARRANQPHQRLTRTSLVSHRIRGIQVAMKAIVVQGHIQINNITITQGTLVRDTMADDLID